MPVSDRGRRSSQRAALAAATNARIRSGSLTPFARSTPEDTSTAGAPDSRIASATFDGSSPPASSHGPGARQPRAMDQSNAAALPPGRVAPGGGFASISSASAPSRRAGRSAAA